MFTLDAYEVSITAIQGFGCLQKVREFEALLKMVSDGKPERILEIGAGNGGSSWAWSKIKSVKQLITVDLPNGPWGGSNIEAMVNFIKSKSVCPYEYIAGNSHDEATFQKVKAELGDHKFDFLFIDGDHSYEGVKKDYEMYSELVAPGGLIAFHDICVHAPETQCEVSKFWQELTLDRTIGGMQIIDEPTNWGGIGAIIK